MSKLVSSQGLFGIDFVFNFRFFAQSVELENGVDSVLEFHWVILVLGMIAFPFIFKAHFFGQCLKQLIKILNIKFWVASDVRVILIIRALNLFDVIYSFLLDLWWDWDTFHRHHFLPKLIDRCFRDVDGVNFN